MKTHKPIRTLCKIHIDLLPLLEKSFVVIIIKGSQASWRSGLSSAKKQKIQEKSEASYMSERTWLKIHRTGHAERAQEPERALSGQSWNSASNKTVRIISHNPNNKIKSTDPQ